MFAPLFTPAVHPHKVAHIYKPPHRPARKPAPLHTPANKAVLGAGLFGQVVFVKKGRKARKTWFQGKHDPNNFGERIVARVFSLRRPKYLLNLVRTPKGVDVQYFKGITLEKWMKSQSGRPDPTILGKMCNSFSDSLIEASEYRLMINDSHTNNVLVNPHTGEVKLIDYGQWGLAKTKKAAYAHNFVSTAQTCKILASVAFLRRAQALKA